MAGLFQNFIAGRQAGMAEQDRARAIQQQELQNQLLMQDQQMQQKRFEREEAGFGREQEFNQLAAKYLGEETVGTLGVPQTGGPAAQVADAQISQTDVGPPQFPGAPPQQPSQGRQPLSQLIGLDPARALEVEKVRSQRIQQQQGQVYNLATRALSSGKPAAMFKYLLAADKIGDLDVKALRDNLTEQGIDVDSLDDDQASQILSAIAEKSAVAAGISAPAPVAPTDDIKEYEYARRQGYGGTFDQFQIDMKRAGAANTNVNLPGTKYPNAFQEGLAKADVTRLEKYQQQAEGATEMVKTLDKLQQLSPTALAGGKAERRAEIANWVQGLTGIDVIDPKVLADTQNYNALVSKAVIDRLGGSLGTGVSNSDVTFIKETVPKLESSREARDALISYLRMRAGEQVQLYDEAREYGERNGGLKGFDKQRQSGGQASKVAKPKDYSRVSDADLKKELGL